MHRRSLIILIILTALVVSLVPVTAYANLFTSTSESVLSSLLGLVVDFLNLIRGLLIEFIAVLGTLLNAVIGQPELSYGGAAVYTIWKIFRDMCNILFIVMFIFVSFGTIFNVLWKNPFYYRTALMGIIIAAISINFSLAIGQTIVWAGNFATGMATTLISGKNVGAQIATALQLPKVVMGQQGLSVNAVPDEVTPINQQNPVQGIISANFNGNAKIVFENCQKYNQQPTVDGCASIAARVQAQQNGAIIDKELSDLNQSPSLKSRLQDAWSFWSNAAHGAAKGAASGGFVSYVTGGYIYNAAIGAWNGAELGPKPKETAKLSSSEAAQKILSLILNIFLLLVLTLSFCTVILFLVVRIPMIWLLLSFSSLAFFSSVWPNSAKLKTWFNNLLGWCIFSPLYLLVIYIGLFLLSQQNTLLAGMKNAAFISGSFGVILFYVMTAAIFIGGARYAMKYAFALSSSAGTAFGAIGSALGVSEKTNFGINTLSKQLGVTAYGEAVGARAQQAKQDITAAARGRFPALLRTEEEAKALARARLGVRGGEVAYEAEIAKRVKAQKDIIEAGVNKLDKTKQDAYLQSQFRSGNRDASLAAGEILLSRGALDTSDSQKMLDKYEKISPLAKKEFQKRVTEQFQKNAGKRSSLFYDKTIDPVTKEEIYTFNRDKFLETAKGAGKSEEVKKFLVAAVQGETGQQQSFDGAQIEDLTKLMSSPDDQRAFLDAMTKSGRSKVAAIETMANRGLIVDRNGKRLSTSDALTERADSLSDLDLLDADDYYQNTGGLMPDELKEKMKKSLKKPEKFGQIIKNTSGPEQQLRILEKYADLKTKSSEAKRDKKDLQKVERRFTTIIKDLQQKQKKAGSIAKKDMFRKAIEAVEVRRQETKDKIDELQKEISPRS